MPSTNICHTFMVLQEFRHLANCRLKSMRLEACKRLDYFAMTVSTFLCCIFQQIRSCSLLFSKLHQVSPKYGLIGLLAQQNVHLYADDCIMVTFFSSQARTTSCIHCWAATRSPERWGMVQPAFDPELRPSRLSQCKITGAQKNKNGYIL